MAESAGRQCRHVPDRHLLAMLLVTSCATIAGCRLTPDDLAVGFPKYDDAYITRSALVANPDPYSGSDERHLHLAHRPRTIREEGEQEFRDLSLDECVQLCLTHSRAIRNQAQFASAHNPLLTNPAGASSIYDPAIHQSGVLFGQRGVQAALSDFDGQFTTSLLAGSNQQVQNNTLSLGLPAGEVLAEETGVWNLAIEKQLATGGSVTLSQNWNYNGSNIGTPPLLFPTVYQGTAQVQFRQPLLAGAGTEYTRIAGPVSDNLQGVSGVSQGVLIARINEDIALADFERSVQQLLFDLESAYWQLSFAYRHYAIQVEARDSAERTWQTVQMQIMGQSGPGGDVEAALRDAYWTQQELADAARDAIFAAEAQLRLLMGLPVSEDQLLRPSDSPLTAEFVPDWYTSLSNAFVLRPEIRRQKWTVHSLELQQRAAENLARPRLDFVSGYQVNGFGDDLFYQGGGAPDGRYSSAYRDLVSGDQAGWSLGFQYSVPFGLRYARTQVHSMELQLAKARAMLAEQETEISHEVAAVFRDIDRQFAAMQSAERRVTAARDRLSRSQAKYQRDPATHSLEMVAQANQAVTQAELALVTSTRQYNVAVANLYLRTGRLLQLHGVLLQGESYGPTAGNSAFGCLTPREPPALQSPFLLTAPEPRDVTSESDVTHETSE